ncbi:MAG: cell wall metabolism sensor histidine kinase WalK [Vallitalea sp.]|jgi:two-component system sensor histidine kinase VicK|nr:cell wall metabolism sensor histidine kinase WalK [Vallitalea sp.]
MTRSIKWRMVSIYVLLVLIVMIASGTLIVTKIRNNAYKDIEENLKGAISDMKNRGISDAATEEEIIIKCQDYINSYQDSDRKIYLLNTNGIVTFPEKYTGTSSYFNTMVMAALNDSPINKTDKVYLDEKEYRGYAEPIKLGNKIIGVIYMLEPSEQVKQNLISTVKIIILAIVLAIFLSVVFGVMFSNFLTKPIIALSDKARAMSQGDLDNEIEVLSNDEIGELTKNFNIMAKTLNNNLIEISSEKNKLETVFAHMTDGILVFDAFGVLIHSNPASKDFIDLIDKFSFGEIMGDYLEVTYDEILRNINTEIRQYIIQIDNKYVNLCFAPYLDQKDNILGNICVLQDITEHKKLEEMQKEFVANVSHELRTPLTTIKSYAETLLDGAMEDPEIATNFLNVINHEGDRMTELVKDLLELSRLDNKQTKFKMQSISLSKILEGSISKFQIHAKKKNQTMVYNSPEIDYKITGDPNRVEQVIKNIISNAVKYSFEDANITIDLIDKDRYVVVSIQDTGMGIPDEDLGRIFERFYRVDKARSRAMGGTGLGLAIAKEIMDYHGGHIKVKSEVGSGTCFSLYFPHKVA